MAVGMKSQAERLLVSLPLADTSDHLRALLLEIVWRLDHPPMLGTDGLLTIAPDTTFAPTEAHPSAVQEQASTPRTETTSQPLDPPGIQSGHAGRACWCAQGWTLLHVSSTDWKAIEVRDPSGARRWYELTVVPAAAPVSSTSLSELSKQSAASSPAESVTSRSAWLSELQLSILGLNDFEAKTESDKGYQMGITTASAWLDMHARKLLA